MNTPPVLVILFNRPDKVRALMEQLAALRPTRLYLAADGPRPSIQTDTTHCAEARTIAEHVTWPCEVRTRFSDHNLGVDTAVETAIDWFFEQELEGIILEDDCIPSPDFMVFAKEMLERYRNDERVMMVSGNNFQDGIRHGDGSYYFSQYPNTWGWATWKRAWEQYDTTLQTLDTFIASKHIQTIRPYRDEQRYWLRYFRKLRRGIYTAWDAKWVFTLWNAGGVSITPNMNLVRNIGFDAEATHTTDTTSTLATTTEPLDIPIQQPSTELPNEAADRYLFMRNYRVPFIKRVLLRIRKLFI